MYSKYFLDVLPYLALSGDYKSLRPNESDRMVNNADINSLLGEYNLIKDKKSTLSSRERSLVIKRVEKLIEKGALTIKNQ